MVTPQDSPPISNGDKKVTRRQCAFQSQSGKPCRMAPLKGSQYCWVHSPEHVQQAQEARRLGGLRRRRESTISNAYQLEALSNVDGLYRVLVVAILDTLAMDNGIARNRTLAYLIMVALKALEVGNIEERIEALEELAQIKKLPLEKGDNQ